MEFPKAALKHPLIKRAAAFVVGAIAGFAYYYFIGCASGACPISSNPWISTAYGGLLGLLMTLGTKQHKAQPENVSRSGE